MGTSSELEAAVAAFQASHLEEDGQRVAQCFNRMATTILEACRVPSMMLGATKDEEVIRFVVFVAFNRIHLYNPDKGIAFNYFTSVMLNYLRKEHRRWKKREKLEGMYGRYL